MDNPFSKYGMVLMAVWFTVLGYALGWVVYG